MCELLCMSARFPTTMRLSLDELARHGGGTGPHRDGWGIGFWQDGDALVIREPDAAHGSQWIRFLHDEQPRTSLAIAHLRRATQGARSLRNTQPFSRELGGRAHLFVHNGMLPGIEDLAGFRTLRFRRIGDTDSEQAFCSLLERLAPLWERGVPTVEERLAEVGAFASRLRELGPANFIYTDGDVVFAHGHRRRHDGGDIRAPGLHVLCRSCSAASDANPLDGTLDATQRQHVALIASVPLTGEGWRALADGEIVMLREGRVSVLADSQVK